MSEDVYYVKTQRFGENLLLKRDLQQKTGVCYFSTNTSFDKSIIEL